MASKATEERKEKLAPMVEALTDADIEAAEKLLADINAKHAFTLPEIDLEVIPCDGGSVMFRGSVALVPPNMAEEVVFNIGAMLKVYKPGVNVMTAAIHRLSELRKANLREGSRKVTPDSVAADLQKLNPEQRKAILAQFGVKNVAAKAYAK